MYIPKVNTTLQRVKIEMYYNKFMFFTIFKLVELLSYTLLFTFSNIEWQ